MAGPWEKYGGKSGPWSKYGAEKPAAQAEPGPSVAEDIIKAGGAGLARGALDVAGLPGTIGGLIESGLDWTFGFEPSELEKKHSLTISNPLGGENFKNIASDVTGGATDYKGKTTPGKYAGTAAEFLPGAAAFGGMSPANLTKFGILPGVASEGAGQLTEGTALEPYARIAAALLAPSAASLASRVITPFPASPERLRMADRLAQEGVDLTAGQRTGSDRLRYMESELGGRAGQQMMERQGEQFTDAAMRRAGAGGRATPDNMTALRDRLGQGFDDISARNVVAADQPLVADVNRVFQDYGRVLPSEQRQIAMNLGQDIVERFRTGGGQMPGADYQTIRSRLSRMAKSNSQRDPEFADAIRGMRNALDDAMTRSVRPEDAQEWAQLRREYGNMKTLERAATGAGEDAAMGIISPAQLRTAATTGRRGQYARAEGDLDELARAGTATMKPLPNSGTASRISARMGGAGLSGVIGALLGNGAMPGVGTVVGGVAGAALPAAIGRAMLSRPGRAYLGNQMVGAQRLLDPRLAAVVASLLGNQQQRLQGP